MKRYAFIDVQNTDSTTRQVLGFTIDWFKMYEYLKQKWGCEQIFFYSGIRNNDSQWSLEHQKLSELGYIVRDKLYSIYKTSDQIVKIFCPQCGSGIEHRVSRGNTWKSNCDVELSVDATNLLHSLNKEDAEFLFFTGDGDFEYLAKTAIEKGVRVYIISSALRLRKESRYFISRLSSKLRKLVSENPNSSFFIEINDWRMKIQKEKKENAIQAGVF